MSKTPINLTAKERERERDGAKKQKVWSSTFIYLCVHFYLSCEALDLNLEQDMPISHKTQI